MYNKGKFFSLPVKTNTFLSLAFVAKKPLSCDVFRRKLTDAHCCKRWISGYHYQSRGHDVFSLSIAFSTAVKAPGYQRSKTLIQTQVVGMKATTASLGVNAPKALLAMYVSCRNRVIADFEDLATILPNSRMDWSR